VKTSISCFCASREFRGSYTLLRGLEQFIAVLSVFMSDLGEMRHKRSEHDAFMYIYIACVHFVKSGAGSLCLSYGRKKNQNANMKCRNMFCCNWRTFSCSVFSCLSVLLLFMFTSNIYSTYSQLS
jgi:hypothetical protein